MKKLIFYISCFIAIFSANLYAQGGIGIMPREDIVKLRAVVRDSLSNEVVARITDLKRYAAASQLDSAAAIIAFNGGAAKTGKWTRASNLQDPDEASRVTMLLEKLKKLDAELPEMKGQYYAVFKDADNPAGQKHLYQINCLNGAKKRMVSFIFYPIEDKMMLADFN